MDVLMFCEKCGSQISDGAGFCSVCGAKVNAAALDAISFSDIEKFYNDNIKGKPVTIILMGDPKKIDTKAIEAKVGCKVTKVTTGKLFNGTQELFDAVM